MNPSTAVVLIVILVIGLLALKSYLRKLERGCCTGAARRNRPTGRHRAHYPYRVTVRIVGMTCPNCALRIENAFNALPGVYARVDLKREQADVRMKTEIPQDRLRRAVEDAGYSAGDIF